MAVTILFYHISPSIEYLSCLFFSRVYTRVINIFLFFDRFFGVLILSLQNVLIFFTNRKYYILKSGRKGMKYHEFEKNNKQKT